MFGVSVASVASGATKVPAGTSVIVKDDAGLIAPFKLKDASLADFVRRYAELTGKRISVGGAWNDELKGHVTLFEPKPVSAADFDEVFHGVLRDNGYSVVDAPGKAGWIVMRARDARDAVIPVYDVREAGDLPATHRLVTAIYQIRYAHAENVARFMRSFMPANSRIIPVSRSSLAVTDSGRNIRKHVHMIQLIDVEAAAKKPYEPPPTKCDPPGASKEQRIEKLVVEKLEIPGGAFGASTSPSPQKGGGK